MQIYVVKAGDFLHKIAQRYGITANEIASANEVPDPNRLAVGQTLVIPVKGPEKTKPTVDVNAYIDPRMTRARSAHAVEQVGRHLTYLTIFNYAVNMDGSLTPVEDQMPLTAARNQGVLPLLVLTNVAGGQFRTEVATALFASDILQERVLDRAMQIMAAKGYRGLDFDFEYLGRENREGYVRFLQKAATRLKPRGYFISAALAPKMRADQPGKLYEGHDYAAIGQVVDFIFCMTYEWGWSGGRPMAVSPVGQVRKVMEYAVTAVPRQKLMMGIPLYGYDWTLPYVPGGTWAKSISPQEALRRAIRHGVAIHYNQTVQAPWFRYTDERGRQHEVWFEDARSIQAKFNLVKKLGLRGFYYWVLGNDFPQNWLLVEDNFTVRKRT